jgi:hypothetical protein
MVALFIFFSIVGFIFFAREQFRIRKDWEESQR